MLVPHFPIAGLLPNAPPLPFPIVSILISLITGVIIIALLVRVVASWFRIDERFAIIRFMAYITDPFITPIRRIVRPMIGPIDLSYLIVFFFIGVIRTLLLQSLPPGW